MIEILSPGVLALVQDLGRHGLAHYGVAPSGAADRGSHLRANALVGNRRSAAALELVAPGFSCRFVTEARCALSGAPAAATLDGHPVDHDSVFTARAGQILELAAAPWGLRTSLAVRGGVAVEAVLGSRSRDTLAHLGPAPLAAGDLLPVGAETDEQDWRAPAPAAAPPDAMPVPLIPAPGAEWVDMAPLGRAVFTVTTASGRAAIRVDGPTLPRRRDQEFPTQALVRGAVQVPPDGRPIVFLADHPLTGGYPVIGVVGWPHTDRLAQLRPGDRFRLAVA